MTLPSLRDLRLSLARRGARSLYAHGARRVWMFGSLAGDRAQDRRSDLDFAVEGIPGEALPSIAEGLSAALGCRVDVVDVATAPPALRAGILHRREFLPEEPDARAGREPDAPRWLAATPEPHRRLFLLRIEAAVGAIEESGARRVIDLGCGRGWLIDALARAPWIEAVTGVDLSREALDRASSRLRRTLSPAQLARVTLFQGLVTHRDPRFASHDTAVATEVMEHLDELRLAAFERVLFDFIRPRTAILTTPNADYNVRWRPREGKRFRHDDHRFELGRAEFARWTEAIGQRFGYDARTLPVGPIDAEVGAPTQMAVLTRRSQR